MRHWTEIDWGPLLTELLAVCEWQSGRDGAFRPPATLGDTSCEDYSCKLPNTALQARQFWPQAFWQVDHLGLRFVLILD
jgi:hypothetical protein